MPTTMQKSNTLIALISKANSKPNIFDVKNEIILSIQKQYYQRNLNLLKIIYCFRNIFDIFIV